MVSHSLKFYTVYNVLFHKNEGANIVVINCMSRFYMFVPTKATFKLANGNTGYSQGIGIILFCFNSCFVIYSVAEFYYFPGHPSNIISSVALKFYVGFQDVTFEPLEHCDFIDPQARSWRSPYKTQNNLDYIQIEIVKVNPQRNRNIFVPTICAL